MPIANKRHLINVPVKIHIETTLTFSAVNCRSSSAANRILLGTLLYPSVLPWASHSRLLTSKRYEKLGLNIPFSSRSE